MVPLVGAMNHPRPLNQVRVAIMDDPHVNAASAGGGEFYVTTGLLQKANDDQLRGCWPMSSPTTISAMSPRRKRSAPEWASA